MRKTSILSAVFLVQAAAFYGVQKRPELVTIAPLAGFPDRLAEWNMQSDETLSREILQVLRPDDYLARTYREASTGRRAELFVSYYGLRDEARAPHSPQTCLTGAGWNPTLKDEIRLSFADGTPAIQVNRYLVKRSGQVNAVLYWFQTGSRALADQQENRLWAVADLVRSKRSDSSLVRIIVPVSGEVDADDSFAAAVRLAQSVYPELCKWFRPL